MHKSKIQEYGSNLKLIKTDLYFFQKLQQILFLIKVRYIKQVIYSATQRYIGIIFLSPCDKRK